MNEEVANKTVHLAIQTGKVTVKTILKGLHAWYRHHQRKKDVARMAKDFTNGKSFPEYNLVLGDTYLFRRGMSISANISR